MPEGFNSIADLKIVVDANTEKLHGGLELAQGLISRFKGGADEQLGAFDTIVQKAAGGVGMLVTRLGAVGVALGVASEAIAQAKEIGRDFAAATGTEEQFQRLEASVDELQDAIVDGLYHALDGARTRAAALVPPMQALAAQQAETKASTESLVATIQNGLSAAIEGVNRHLRELGPESNKSVSQIEWEIARAIDKIKRLREEGETFLGLDLGPLRQKLGLGDDEQIAQIEAYIERLKELREERAAVEAAAAGEKSMAAATKTLEALDKEVKSLEQKASVLGMTAAETAQYIVQQQLFVELEGQSLEYTEQVNAAFAERAEKIAAAAKQIADYNKAEEERKKAEQREEQIKKTVAVLDEEVAAMSRRSNAYTMNKADAEALDAAERKLAAIRQAGREPTESEIAQIRLYQVEMRGAIAVNNALAKAQQDRQKAEQEVKQKTRESEMREKQIGRIIEDIDVEIDAQMRKAAAVNMTTAEQVAAERVERSLLAIKRAGREPTEAEIAGIRRKGDALREILQVNEDVKRSMQSMQEYGRAVTSSLESAFRQFASTGKFEVKDMVRSMLQDLAMLAMKQNVFGPLQQGFSGLLGSLFGGLGGGSFGSSWTPQVIPAFAEGGRPPLSGPSLIGERGPEIWWPDSAGTVIPNEILRALGSGGSGGRAGGEIVVTVAPSEHLYAEIDNRADGVVTRRAPEIAAATMRQTHAALPGMVRDIQKRKL